MGKRKVARAPTGHTEEQCDVWLTAKPLKKQRLRRDPLHFYNGQLHDEPILAVCTATRQTTLNDFFKKSSDSKTDQNRFHLGENQHDQEHRNPDSCSTEKQRNFHQSQTTQENMAQIYAHVATSPTLNANENLSPYVTRSFHEDLHSNPPVKDLVSDGFNKTHGNEKPTDRRCARTQQQNRCRRVEGKTSSNIPEKENWCLQSDPDEDVMSVDENSCLRSKDVHKHIDTSLRHSTTDFSADDCDSQLPFSCLSQSRKVSSQSPVDSPVTDRLFRIAFVPSGEADSSFVLEETELESNDQLAICSPSSFAETNIQPSLNIDMLRYVDSRLLDTAPMPDSQTETCDSREQVITSISLAESDYSDSTVVDPALSEFDANTTEVSTEGDWVLSEGDPANATDQSPFDSLEFTADTQGCLILKTSPAPDIDESDVDDSQTF
ncbi:uncharacterized protein LOC110980967 isoform X2 [Acanthaster planci]|uniref:Uncharacterized protein LOC110980967 isoform X2 n=1 Tax=Acanthaster planci TaxID=133434 RepID=A0A8B7YKG5_ACAPL|nr:uncharacterized protein LOC110980967 isoform X2 [Acanthaster planci]